MAFGARGFEVRSQHALMLNCSAGHLLLSAISAAAGYAGLGVLPLACFAMLLALSALTLAASFLCCAIGLLGADDETVAPRT